MSGISCSPQDMKATGGDDDWESTSPTPSSYDIPEIIDPNEDKEELEEGEYSRGEYDEGGRRIENSSPHDKHISDEEINYPQIENDGNNYNEDKEDQSFNNINLNTNQDDGDGKENDDGSGNGTIVCPICMSDIKQPVATRCGHMLCFDCLEGWCDSSRSSRRNCPICRTQLDLAKDVIPIFIKDGPSGWDNATSDEAKEFREKFKKFTSKNNGKARSRIHRNVGFSMNFGPLSYQFGDIGGFGGLQTGFSLGFPGAGLVGPMGFFTANVGNNNNIGAGDVLNRRAHRARAGGTNDPDDNQNNGDFGEGSDGNNYGADDEERAEAMRDRRRKVRLLQMALFLLSFILMFVTPLIDSQLVYRRR